MTITPSLFEAFLKCPTKCWLRATSETPSGNTYAEWVQSQNDSYRATETDRLLAERPPAESARSPSPESLKSSKWRLAVDVVVRTPPLPRSSRREEAPSSTAEGGLRNAESDQSLVTSAATPQPPAPEPSFIAETHLHAVERAPAEGRGKAAQFIPTRFIFFNKLGKDDKLLLAFDAFVLSAALGRDMPAGKIIHGDTRSCACESAANFQTGAAGQQPELTTSALSQAHPQVLKVKTSSLAGEVRKRLERIAALLSSPTPPDLILNRHCGESEFQSRCRKLAVEKDDLSLLGGMSEKERREYRSKGIFTVTQLSYTFRPRRRPKKLRDKKEKYHHSLKALAIREKKIHIVGSPELKIEGTPVYLDVEGLPDRDFYYLIGLRIGNGESSVQHSLWADTVEDEGKIWREFLTIVETVEKPVLIHYGSYETAYFKRMGENYGGPLDGSSAEKAIESAVNLVSAIFARVYFPTYSSGLKDIAGYLGFKWTEAEPSGLKTIIWRNRWAEDRSQYLRDKLANYNSEDCQALEILVRAMTGSGSTQESGKSPGGLAANAVNAEAIPHDAKWGNFSSPIPEFEQINRAARWDYQRDRVYARKGTRIRTVLKVKVVRSKKPERANKVVVDPDELPCPQCGCLGLAEAGLRTIAVEDMIFGRNSLKWSVVAHQYHRHRCQSCGLSYGSPSGFWPRSKFGRNLVAYILYHVIELAVPQHAVKRSLHRLFGYGVPHCALPRIKAMAGQIYEETRMMILEKIVRGNLVHVDETRANIRGRTGYVWVFTSLQEVVYLYSDSREGEIAQRTLASFKGVLVSDFFSAYDSFACPQQKCLIHLMRDLNGQVIDWPFDEELKRIVMGFAGILNSMVATVDHYGLKTHFLRKHLKEVERFYKQIERMNLQSEAAVRCRERFERNRGKLFTFLEHDGIPWNNNNAEHAIKAFAALRDVMEGCATEKSIESYLILLSVCQTCKYMGVDFLDFLRSGEKDIYAFAESQRGRRRRSTTSESKTPPADAPPEQ